MQLVLTFKDYDSYLNLPSMNLLQ